MTAAAIRLLAGQPCDDEGPIFNEPWEARAFALVVQLSETGVFTWEEWVRTFSAEIAHAEQHGYDPKQDYYGCWLHALEDILTEKGLIDDRVLAGSIAHTIATWPHPPHGAVTEPVSVSPPGAGL